MASTSEKGHAKNLSNFEELVSYVTGYGAIYNPSKASIKLPALTSLQTNARNALNAYNAAYVVYKIATDDREVAYEPLNKLSTRVLNALKATDTTTQVDDSARSFVRKIQGKRATPKKTDEEKAAALAQGKEIKEISSSQMSYDNRLESFDKLIRLLSNIPQYTPNETDLKVATLTATFNTLKAKNTAVLAAETTLSNARVVRDNVFYSPLSGIVDIAVDTKTYVKSLFGATSIQYKQISKISLKSIHV